jgi:hypothetical protein
MDVAEFTEPYTEAVLEISPGSKRVTVPEKELTPVMVGSSKVSPILSKNKAWPEELITP